MSLPEIHLISGTARGYPTYWESDGHGGHCLQKVEWLAKDGTVLTSSDYEHREKYLSFACQFRAPYLASHWEFLLEPLVLHHSGKTGLIRYGVNLNTSITVALCHQVQ